MKWPSRKEAPYGGLGMDAEERRVMRGGDPHESPEQKRVREMLAGKRCKRTTAPNIPPISASLKAKMLARVKGPDKETYWVRETADKKLDKMLSEALDYTDSMNDWERDFLDSLVPLVEDKGGMTQKQYNVLERILDKYGS